MKYAELDRLIDSAKDDAEAAHDAANVLNVDFWGGPDDEAYSYTDLDEYVESFLDACHPAIPDSMEVIGARRMVMSACDLDAEQLAEDLYERLDEEYNGGDDPSEPPHAVFEAARAFIAVVRRNYVPWNCEEAVRVTLDAADVRRKIAEFWPEESQP